MRRLIILGIVFGSMQYLLASDSTSTDGRDQENENDTQRGVDYSKIAKRFDPYPYDDGREDFHKRFELLDKRFDPFQKRFDAYEKRFDPYQKRFDPYSKRFDPYQKRFDPMEKRFDPFEKRSDAVQKRFDPYEKRSTSFIGPSRPRRVDFNPLDTRAFFVTLG